MLVPNLPKTSQQLGDRRGGKIQCWLHLKVACQVHFVLYHFCIHLEVLADVFFFSIIDSSPNACLLVQHCHFYRTFDVILSIDIFKH